MSSHLSPSSAGSPRSPPRSDVHSAPSSYTSPGASSSSGGSTPSRPPSAIFVGNSSAAYTAAMAAGDPKDASDEKTVSRGTRGRERSSSFRTAVGKGGLPSPPATNSDATSSAGKAAGKAALGSGTLSRAGSRRAPADPSLVQEPQMDSLQRGTSLTSRHRVSSNRRNDRKNFVSSTTHASSSFVTEPAPERTAAHYSALMSLTNTSTPLRRTQPQSSGSSESTPKRPTPSAGSGRSPGTESLRKMLSRQSSANSTTASPGSPVVEDGLTRRSSRHHHTASSPSRLSVTNLDDTSASPEPTKRSQDFQGQANGIPSPAYNDTHLKRRGLYHVEASPVGESLRRSQTESHSYGEGSRRSPMDEVARARERVGTWISGQEDEDDGTSRFGSGGSGGKRKPLPQDFRNGSLFTPSPKSADIRDDTRRESAARATSSFGIASSSSPRRSATIASRGHEYQSPATPYTPSGLSRVRQDRPGSSVERVRNSDDESAYARRTCQDSISGLPGPSPRNRPVSEVEGISSYRYQSRGGSAESGLTHQRLVDRDRLRSNSTSEMTPSPGRSRLSHLDSVSQQGHGESSGTSDPLKVLARMEQAREESQRRRAMLLQERPQSVVDYPRSRERGEAHPPRPSSRAWTPIADRQPLRSATSLSFIRDRGPRTAPAAQRVRHFDVMPDSPSVGRGGSRASQLAASDYQAEQSPRAMRSNSSLGSHFGQLPASSVTEHGRLLLEACRSMETRLAPDPRCSELLRSSQSAARTSESSNTHLREALVMATQAQIEIEVEGRDGREVLFRLISTLREASKQSDESVRSLTGVLLSLPKVLRDTPRRSGSFDTNSANGHASSGRSSVRHVRTPADFTSSHIDLETISSSSAGGRTSVSRYSMDQESPKRAGSLLSFTSRKLFNGKTPDSRSSPGPPLPSIPSSQDIQSLSSLSQSSPTKSSSSFLRKRPSTLTVKGHTNSSSFFPAIRGSAPTTAISQVTVGDAATSPSQGSFITSPPLNSAGSDPDDTISMLERKLAYSEARQSAGVSIGQRSSEDSKSSSGRPGRFWRRASKGSSELR